MAGTGIPQTNPTSTHITPNTKVERPMRRELSKGIFVHKLGDKTKLHDPGAIVDSAEAEQEPLERRKASEETA